MRYRGLRLFSDSFSVVTIVISCCCAATTAPGQSALKFNGANNYVTFGSTTSALGATNFTVECWFKRTGAGASTASTGTGGASGYPIIARGRGESESPGTNCNYFLGHTSGNLLVADFEELTGPNHPLTGTHTMSSNVWHHVALTYDGATLKLYLDGALDNSVAATGVPDYTTLQGASLGSAQDSKGALAGFLAGQIDEPRIWNYARSQAQIQGSMNTEITSASGLIGRWGLNEGAGTTAINSIASSPDGTLSPTSPTWVTDSPFSAVAQSVVLTNPVNGAAIPLGSPVTLGATATMSAPISRVDFYVAGAKVGQSTTAPYALGWTPATQGTFGLMAVAVDNTSQSITSAVVNVTCYPAGSGALQFNGLSSYVTFGQATTTLGASNFTLECWFKRTGKGVMGSTGIGGTSGAALIAKGRGEADANNKDCNYFLGVDSSGRLVADFEEGATGSTVGLNHPIGGRTACTNGVWTHAALTYDGFTLLMYLNGVLDATLDVNEPPRWDSIQHAAIGAALNSTGAADAFFDGQIDEARIWNYARSAEQIADSMYTSITQATGLLGRWGLEEVSGTTATNSVSGSPAGTLVNNPTWSQGVALVAATNTPPSVGFSSPADGATLTVAATNPIVILSAFAADDGVVTNVAFYEGNNLLGNVSSSPWSLTWSNLSYGIYTLSLVAADDSGLLSTSAPVQISLVPPNYAPVVVSHLPVSATVVSNLAPRLSLTANDPEGAPLEVTFRGRLNVTNSPGPDFTVVALPDTQFYNGSLGNIYQMQIDWIIANRTAMNIVYVASLGDIVNDGDAKPNEWLAATNALYRLDNPALTGLASGIPYGTVPGNHDHNNAYGGTTLYNRYFGVDHFAGKPWYGGHLGYDNQNHFDLISVSGLDFVFVYIDFDYGYLDYTQVDPWSDSVIKGNSDRRAVVLTHDLLAVTGNFDPRGNAIYNNLKDNPNLFLMLCGHNHGQWNRRDTNGTQVVTTCLSDYQDFPNGGNGYLRTYTFSPSNNVIHVNTYSPYLGQYLTTNFNNSPSAFDIPYQMNDAKPAFQYLGSTNVASGATASISWNALAPSQNYEWYASISDGTNSVTTSVFQFNTATWTNLAATLNHTLAPSSGDRRFRAYFDGVPGAGYAIERATNVAGPWVWQTNIVAPVEDLGIGAGTFEVGEPADTADQAFFRVVYPAYTP